MFFRRVISIENMSYHKPKKIRTFVPPAVRVLSNTNLKARQSVLDNADAHRAVTLCTISLGALPCAAAARHLWLLPPGPTAELTAWLPLCFTVCHHRLCPTLCVIMQDEARASFLRRLFNTGDRVTTNSHSLEMSR